MRKKEFRKESLQKNVLTTLHRYFLTVRQDIGEDRELSARGTMLRTKIYEIPGLGHLCILRMRAMIGLMKMETAVLVPFEKDLPLMNLDWVRVLGKETQIIELYDVQLEEYPADYLETFQVIRDRDLDIADPKPGKPHWYDEILYPCSYHDVGVISHRF